jgi:hypothetical protein
MPNGQQPRPRGGGVRSTCDISRPARDTNEPSGSLARNSPIGRVHCLPRPEPFGSCGQGRGRTADLPLFRCSGCPAHGGCGRVLGCLRLRRGADDCRCCRHGCRLRYEWTFRLRGGESKWLAAAVVVAVTAAIRSACSGISASTVPSPVIASRPKGA